MTLDLSTLPMSAKQIESIVESRNHRISIWSGAVRSGKTISSIVAFFIAVAEAPRSGLILITGRTLQTIERNIIEPMQDPEVFGRLSEYVHHTRGSSVAVIFGRTVHLIGASDVRAEGKLRGLSACLALVDEATLLPEEFWTQLLARLSIPGARCLATTNPGSPYHFLKTKFIDRIDEMDLGYWHFTVEDNPSLAADYVAALKAEFTGLFYRRFILGHWVSADGAIYDMWDTDRHIVQWEDLPPMQEYFGVGIDYGTTNATAAVLLGLGHDGILYAVDEWRYAAATGQFRKTDAQLSAGVRNWITKPHLPDHHPQPATGPVIVDPAAASFRVQLKQDGTHSYPAMNEVLYGIRLVASLLERGKLKVSSRCKGVLLEIPGYSWDPKATEHGKDFPITVADHSLDAFRYVISTTEKRWRRYVDLGSAPATPEELKQLDEAA